MHKGQLWEDEVVVVVVVVSGRVSFIFCVREEFLKATYKPKKGAIIRKKNTFCTADAGETIVPSEFCLTCPAFSISSAGK